MAVVRHEDVQVRIYVDGVEKGPFDFTDFGWDPDTQFDSAKYQGRSIPVKDATFNGYRLSGTAQIVRNDLEDAHQLYLAGVKNRTGEGRTRVVVSYADPDTNQRKAMRFENVQWRLGPRTSDGQRVTQSFDGEAEDGRPIQ